MDPVRKRLYCYVDDYLAYFDPSDNSFHLVSANSPPPGTCRLAYMPKSKRLIAVGVNAKGTWAYDIQNDKWSEATTENRYRTIADRNFLMSHDDYLTAGGDVDIDGDGDLDDVVYLQVEKELWAFHYDP